MRRDHRTRADHTGAAGFDPTCASSLPKKTTSKPAPRFYGTADSAERAAIARRAKTKPKPANPGYTASADSMERQAILAHSTRPPLGTVDAIERRILANKPQTPAAAAPHALARVAVSEYGTAGPFRILRGLRTMR